MRARGIEECLFLLLLLLLTSLASSPLHQCASKTCTYHYGNRFGIFLCSSSSFSTHTHTPLLGWSRLKTPIVFPLLLLLLKYYVAIAFLFFSRPKKAMSLGKNWLFCFSYNLLTQELSVKKFYDQLRKYVFLATTRTEMVLEKSLGSKTKARLYQLETIFTHRLDC